MNAAKYYGVLYALLTAIFNGTVGVLSVKLFQSGLLANEVAFYKCAVALGIIVILLALSGGLKAFFSFLKTRWHVAALCAFFGFFVLYHFETAVYTQTNISTVVFVLFGSATVFSFFLTAISERRFLNSKEIITILFSIAGLYLIFMQAEDVTLTFNKGLISAMLAGLGYGLILFLSRRLNFGAGFARIAALLLFGCVYLWFPFEPGVALSIFGAMPFIMLAGLAVLPTIGGFWCTTKALTLTSSRSVQLIELSEPIFAIAFSTLFPGQHAKSVQYLGGTLIFFSIFLHELICWSGCCAWARAGRARAFEAAAVVTACGLRIIFLAHHTSVSRRSHPGIQTPA